VQPHVAINAAARVPATVRLVVVDLDGNDILAAVELHIRREIVFEGRIAVRTRAERGAVDPHLAVHVHAVEIDENLLGRRSLIERERLAIPTDAAVEIPAARARRRARIERQLDAPVVRQIEAAPRRIVEGGALRTGNVAAIELPAGVEAFAPQ